MRSTVRQALAFALSVCLGIGALVSLQVASPAMAEGPSASPTPSVSTANHTLVYVTEAEAKSQSESDQKSSENGDKKSEGSGSEGGSDGSGDSEDGPTKVAVNFTLASLFVIYDGQPHQVAYAVTAPNGSAIPSTISYAGSPSAPSAVGTYTVTVTCTSTKYVCTNPSAILVIAKAPQVIQVGSHSDMQVGESQTITATGGGSHNVLELSSNTSAVCTLIGWTVSAISAGTCRLQIDQAGNENYLDASPLAVTIQVSAVPVIVPTPEPSTTPSQTPSQTPSSTPTTSPSVTPTVDPTPPVTPTPTTTPSVTPTTPTTPAPPAVAAPHLVSAAEIQKLVGDTLDRVALVANTGGEAVFRVDPALPRGLSLNGANGTVSGTALSASVRTEYTVTATNASGSSSTSAWITISKRDQRISANLPASVVYGSGTIGVHPTASSGLGVSYYSSNNAVLRLNNDGSLTPVGVGSTNIVFNQAGNDTYNAAPAFSLAVVVTPRTINLTGVTVTVDKNGNVTFTGGNLDGILPGDLVGFSGNGVTGSYSNGTLNQAGRFTLTGKDAANYILNQGNTYDVKVETGGGSGETLWQPLESIPVTTQPSSGYASVGGIQVATTLRSNTGKNGLELLAPGWQLGLGALDGAGSMVNLGPDGTLRIQRDHTFISTGAGFAPNSNVRLFVFSSPLALGDVSTDARGSFSATFPVPDSLENGLHTLQVVGYSTAGQIQMGEIPVTLVNSISALPAAKSLTGVIYFAPGKLTTLKRSKAQIRKVLTLLGSGVHNPKVKLTVYNSRKDVRPTAILGKRRLKVVVRTLRAKIATSLISSRAGQNRRHHWGYVRYTVTYTNN